ncbi:MAG: DUF2007 domain-containing protein [Chloroflexi bacterium]|nr:DUF2007 domain-containing protein [Chloroflexota bacterium]
MMGGFVLRLPGWLGGRSNADDNDSEAADAERGKGDDEPAPWRAVLETLDEVEARLAAARLEDEGIPTRIRREAASTAIPVNVGILGRIDVLVPEPMVEKALIILEAVLMDEDHDE